MSQFKVTTTRDGRRSFGEHDDRWTDNRDNGRRPFGRRGGGKKTYGNYNRGGGGGYRGDNYRGDNYRGRPDNRSRGGGYNRNGPGPRSRLDDEGDVDMGGSSGPSTSRYTPYGSGRRGDRRSNYNNRGRDSDGPNKYKNFGLPIGRGSDSQWFRVLIPFGKKAGKDSLLKLLNENLNVPLIPVCFHFEQEKAVFHIQDRMASDAIRKLSNKVFLPNGFKMVVIVKPSGPPTIYSLDEEGVEKLKVCMSNRYDPTTKALNLSQLSNDTSLSQDNIHLPLNRHNVITQVANILGENIPELETLDISNNKLFGCDNMRELVKKTPNVIRLNIGQNKIKSIEDLERIKNWNLVELILDGNDLCDRFKDQAAYISAVRKRFPKVIKLDGHDLPPPITFDLETTSSLPEVKGSYFLNQELQDITVKFLKEYFTIYDSNDRQPLLQAYHDEAIFSLATAFNSLIEYGQPKLSDYLTESRNLLKISRDTIKRQKTLKKGKLSIVSHLCELRKTTHDYNSFRVDIDHASASLLSFSVLGVFKEAESRMDKPPIRSFSRHFVTVPIGSGMAIVNDMLTITNASHEQFKKAFKSQAPTPSSSPVPGEGPSVPFPPQAGPSFTPEQHQKIQSFCHESGMNAEWSAKCLGQNAWDYEKSGVVFLELQKQGKIPPEAFVS